MTRYVIIGAGAVGSTVAAQLHQAGRQVILVARGRNLDVLRASGLSYVRPHGTLVLDVPVAGGPEDVALRQDDILVLASKSRDTEDILRTWAWRPVNGTGTAATELPVILLQNGLENERAALRRFATVIGSVVWLPSSHVNAGEVVSPAEPAVGAFWFGAYPSGVHPRPTEIAEDFTAASFHTEVVPDIQHARPKSLSSNRFPVTTAAATRPGRAFSAARHPRPTTSTARSSCRQGFPVVLRPTTPRSPNASSAPPPTAPARQPGRRGSHRDAARPHPPGGARRPGRTARPHPERPSTAAAGRALGCCGGPGSVMSVCWMER